jgi:hypothetical protein
MLIEKSNRTFLKVNSKGYLFQSSQTPREGYEEVVNEKTGDKYYHKTYSGIEAVLDGVRIREARFSTGAVRFIELLVSDNDEKYQISFPLLRYNGGLSDLAINFAAIAANLQIGKRYIISPKKKTETGKDGKQYVKHQQLFFIDPDLPEGKNMVKWAIDMRKEAGVVPPLEKVTKAGKETWNSDKRDEFLYDKLVKAIVGLGGSSDAESSNDTATPQAQTPSQSASATPAADTDANEDDLPF